MVPLQFISPPSLCWEVWVSVFTVGSADQEKIALTSKLQWGVFQMRKVFLWAINHDSQQWLFNISNCCCSVTKSCLTLCDPMNCSLSNSVGFSRQEYWSGFPFPPPEGLPNPGTEPMSVVSPALAGRFSTTRSTGDCKGLDKRKAILFLMILKSWRGRHSDSGYWTVHCENGCDWYF